MSNVWAVIKREYLQRVRSRWFVFATVAGPVMMLVAVLVPAYVADRGDDAERRLAVVDRTDRLFSAVEERLEDGGLTVQRAGTGEAEMSRLLQQVSDGELAGYLVLDAETLRSGRASFYADQAPSPLRSLSLRQAVTAAALSVQLQDRGVDSGALLSGGTLDVGLLGAGDSTASERSFFMGFIGAFVLYMVILLYAVSVMRATLEEKTSRVVEIIVSAMEPWHLMLGKILGVGAVGLTQLGVWALSAAFLAGSGLSLVAAVRPGLTDTAQIRELFPDPGLLVLFVALFLCGFFMFSSLYAAVGAMCSSDEEAQQAQFPVMLLILVPILFITPVLEHPASGFATGLSLVPFFSPILMWARIAAGAAPVWQVALSFVLMGLTVVAVAWLAGRIYKVGILMAGKRPTLPELWRWVREA